MARPHRITLTPLRRHVAAAVTIALSCAFVVVMILAGTLVQESLRAQATQSLDGADLYITRTVTDAQYESDEPLPAPEVEGTEQVWPLLHQYIELSPAASSAASDSEFLSAAYLPPNGTAEDSLTAGELPTTADELVLDKGAATALDVTVGDQVTLPADWSETGTAHSFTVVGIAPAAEGAAFGSLMGPGRVLVSEVNAAALLGPTAGTVTETWLASVSPGSDPEEVAAASSSADMAVITAEQAEADAAADIAGGSGVLGLLAAVFVVIALFTSAVVIANTFAVTIAQRTRALALLRTVGATRAQVRRIVLRESLRVGVLGAAIGMISGHLLVQVVLAAAAATGWLDALMVVPFSVASLVLPLIAGVVITLLASLAPMRSATGVAPLQALRPQAPAPQGSRGARSMLGIGAVVVGVLALIGGTAVAQSGPAMLGVLLAIAGGILSFTGVLLILMTLTRPLSRLLGWLMGRVGGLPARIASANVARNPRRSAATVAALLIGTTLMTMMAVGARTAETTLTAELDSRRPIDLVISAEQMPSDATERIASIDGIGAAHPAVRADIDVDAAIPMTLYGAQPQAVEETSHRPGMAQDLVDGVVLIGAERAEEFGVQDGQVLQVPGADGGTHDLRFQVDANLKMSLVTTDTLERIAGPAAAPVVLADFADPGSPQRAGIEALDIADAVSDETVREGYVDVRTDLGGMEREGYAQVLDILLGITIALLAVAVVVALVGVTNTLSLGVIERTGENALLRALGTTRGQMRAMLTWEGVLLALVGALLGIIIGSIYGVFGITALLGSIYPVTMTIPWLQVILVLVLAVIAGAAASVLPGRRAARTAPATALAED